MFSFVIEGQRRMKPQDLFARVSRRSSKMSSTKYRVVAVGFDRHDKILAITNNRQRFSHFGGGIHAELECVRVAGPKLRKIQLFRFNKHGGVLPIHPCCSCQRVLDKLGIAVVTE